MSSSTHSYFRGSLETRNTGICKTDGHVCLLFPNTEVVELNFVDNELEVQEPQVCQKVTSPLDLYLSEAEVVLSLPLKWKHLSTSCRTVSVVNDGQVLRVCCITKSNNHGHQP